MKQRPVMLGAALMLLAACGSTSDVAQPRATVASAVNAPRDAQVPDVAAAPARSRAPVAPPPDRRTARASTPARASDAPRPPQPASPGIYRFETDGTTRVADGPSRRLPAVTTLQVDPPASSMQRFVRDLRDADGTGSVVEQVLAYAPDGVRLVSLRLRTNFAGVARTYTFEPSPRPLILRTGAAPGDRVTFDAADDGVTVRTEVRVERTDQVRVGAEARRVLVVRIASTISGDIEGTQVAVNAIDPELGLTLHEDVRSDLRQGAVRLRSAYVATLTSLHPS